MPRSFSTTLAATPIAATPINPDPAAAIAVAARLLLPDLERGCRIDVAMLRAAMECAFSGPDAEGVSKNATRCTKMSGLKRNEYTPLLLGDLQRKAGGKVAVKRPSLD